MKLSEAKKRGEEILREAGIRDAEWDARELLFYVTSLDYNSYLLKMDDEMEDTDLLQYGRFIGLRSTHIPLQHITHSQNFMGFDFYVTEDVLVPRQDTETLVEYCLDHLKKMDRFWIYVPEADVYCFQYLSFDLMCQGWEWIFQQMPLELHPKMQDY